MMRRSIPVAILFCAVALLVSGCSSSPRVTYYSLEPIAKPAGSSSVQNTIPTVSVETPTIPEMVDRPQLVERGSGNRVEILEFHRWAEPLKSAIPRMLADNLSRLLESDRVSAYPQNAGSDAYYRVFVDFQRFETEGGGVSVEALWSIRRTSDGLLKQGRSKMRESVGTEGYEGIIAAYGRTLSTLSADIARTIRGEWSTPVR